MPSYTRNHDDRHSAGIMRNCSRCRKELTDAASREAGVGPVCRRKTNDLHALQIEANLNVASALFLSLRSDDFAEECEGFSKTKREFTRKMKSLASRNDDLTAVTLRGEDFRNVVNWFDYALSFRISSAVRTKAIEIVEALGYVGLGGVLRGDACMSPATLLVEGGVIKLSGKACTAGFRAMKRNIPGVQTPRWRGDKRPYVASVAHAEKFVELALRHWPFMECDPSEVLEDARKAADNMSADELESPREQRPVATVRKEVSPGVFSVQTPWHGTREQMNTMLAKFKALPRGDRSYDPGSRAWRFKACHLDTILGVVGERYTVTVA